MRVVYFIQSGAAGPIKIGVTSNVALRLKGLQTGSATELRLLGVVPTDRFSEESLHLRFASLRLHGEWFTATVELLAFVAEVAEAPAQPARRPRKHESHPLGKWMAARGVDCVELASRVVRSGRRRCSPGSIRQIINGLNGPHWTLARIFSEISNGAVSIDEIMEYPYRRERSLYPRRTKAA